MKTILSLTVTLALILLAPQTGFCPKAARYYKFKVIETEGGTILEDIWYSRPCQEVVK